jgi:hypothetical protein
MKKAWNSDIHDNVHLLTPARDRAQVKHFNRELFGYRFYSPDLIPKNNYLIIYQRNFLESQLFNNNEDML